MKRVIYKTRLGNRRGNAYLEYFLAAMAMSVAAVWLWSGGSYRGLRGTLQGGLEAAQAEVGGPFYGVDP
jgi:hypothetical protein